MHVIDSLEDSQCDANECHPPRRKAACAQTLFLDACVFWKILSTGEKEQIGVYNEKLTNP